MKTQHFTDYEFNNLKRGNVICLSFETPDITEIIFVSKILYVNTSDVYLRDLLTSGSREYLENNWDFPNKIKNDDPKIAILKVFDSEEESIKFVKSEYPEYFI